MKIRICKYQNCDKRAITCSEFCGEHTENQPWKTAFVTYINETANPLEKLIIDEIEVSGDFVIDNKTFEFCEFNDCRFENIVFMNCDFSNTQWLSCEHIESRFLSCKFMDCDFSESLFSECEFDKASFDKCTISNCMFEDELLVNDSQFYLCKLSNTNFHAVQSVEGTSFEQCIFSYSGFYESCLDKLEIKYSEFYKATISFCSLREAKLIEIDHDFQEVGPPMANDFYGCEIDLETKQYLQDFYNNFDTPNKLEYYENAIVKLTELDHPNYLPELTQFLKSYQILDDITVFKQKVLDFYRSLYQVSINTNNIMMVGKVINEYTRLPIEIRENLLRLSGPIIRHQNRGAYIELKFSSESVTYSSISQINSYLASLCKSSINNDNLEVISINQGSVIELAYGYLPEIIAFGSALFAASKATLSIIKEGYEVKKLSAEVKKIKAETKKLNQELSPKESKKQNRYSEYVIAIEESELLSDAELIQVNENINAISKNQECSSIAYELNKKYTIKNIVIRQED